MRRRLSDLLGAIPEGRRDCEIRGITCDSRGVRPGWLFVAVPGTARNGAEFIADALDRGAAAIVCEDPPPPGPRKRAWIRVTDARSALADLAARFYAEPSDRLNVIGITGTNGKSTSAFLVKAILEAAGEKPGLLGTIQYVVGARVFPAPMTTPSAEDLQRYLWETANAGARSAVMEVSSHALAQQRARGVRFAAGVFTNLTRDHRDYHRTQRDYLRAKQRLFEMLPARGIAVLNADDPASLVFARRTEANVVFYGLDHPAEVGAEIEAADFGGTRFRLRLGSEEFPVHAHLAGKHNVSNMLAAAAVCWKMGYELEAIKAGLEGLLRVPGRLEPVDAGQDFTVLIDYAHTDDALRTVLEGIRPMARGRLLVVFGCGGDRDRGKRPRMGRVVDQLADDAIVTSDNPRSEEPLEIIREVTRGMKSMKYLIEPDRRSAIRLAISMARKGDVVLVAGKGHEKVQIVGDECRTFDDVEVARDALRELVKR